MRFVFFLLVFFNFFNIEFNKLNSINKEKTLFIEFFDINQKSTTRLIYKDGYLNIEGLKGNAHVSIYSIIGNQIAFFSNADLNNFKEPVPLQIETMYIARIEFSNKVLTHKFFTR